MAPYSCQNAFAIINKTRKGDADTYAYLSLNLCSSGNITGSKEQENIFDASELPGEKLYFNENFVTVKNDFSNLETKIEVHNVDFFLGRSNEIDIIDFSFFPQFTYLVTKGGKGSSDKLKDRLINVSQALLSRYTYVYSILETPHEYDIELNNGDITIDLLNAKELSLNFNLDVADLLRMVISHSEPNSNFELALNLNFIKLSLTFDETEVIVNLRKDAHIFLWSNSKVQISFAADSADNFMVIAEVAKSISPEEKLQMCHTYQELISDEKQLACLMLSEKKWKKD